MADITLLRVGIECLHRQQAIAIAHHRRDGRSSGGRFRRAISLLLTSWLLPRLLISLLLICRLLPGLLNSGLPVRAAGWLVAGPAVGLFAACFPAALMAMAGDQALLDVRPVLRLMPERPQQLPPHT